MDSNSTLFTKFPSISKKSTLTIIVGVKLIFSGLTYVFTIKLSPVNSPKFMKSCPYSIYTKLSLSK